MLKIKVLDFDFSRAYTIEKTVNCLLEEIQRQNGCSLIRTKYFSDSRGYLTSVIIEYDDGMLP